MPRHHSKRSENPVRIRIDEELLADVEQWHHENLPDAYREAVLGHLIRKGLQALRREKSDLTEIQHRLDHLEARMNAGEHRGGGHTKEGRDDL
jgi:hypothetical protein